MADAADASPVNPVRLPNTPLPPPPPLVPVRPDLRSTNSFAVAAGLLTAAAAQGLTLKAFPIVATHGEPGRNWKRRATDNANVLAGWASQHPAARIGVRTGVTGGIIVLEVANPRALERLEEELGWLPTPTVETRSADGVSRLWFRLSPNCPTCPTRLNFAPGARLIGDGGFTVLPPFCEWVAAPDDGDGAVAFRLFPAHWVRQAARMIDDTTPTVRWFT